MMSVHVHFLDGHHAPMRDLAIDILKLDRRMRDMKAIMELRLDLLQNTVALRRWNVSDRYMAR